MCQVHHKQKLTVRSNLVVVDRQLSFILQLRRNALFNFGPMLSLLIAFNLAIRNLNAFGLVCLCQLFVPEVLNEVELLPVLQGSRIQDLFVEDDSISALLNLFLGDGHAASDDVVLQILPNQLLDRGVSRYLYLQLRILVEFVALFLLANLVRSSEGGEESIQVLSGLGLAALPH